MRVVFPYIAQLHQVFHSLPIAAELATRYPHIEVVAAVASDQHADLVRRLIARHAPTANIRIERLRRVLFSRVRLKRKRRTLLWNWRYLRSFDAIVTPERTTLFLKRLGLGRTQVIWSGHGAGDRAVGFASNIHLFDYVLLAGRKIEARLLAEGQIRRGGYTGGIYPKFDWLRAGSTERLFDNDRPVVLYNPHFNAALSSWPRWGEAILDFFAAHPEWNLVFAPHIRLFDPPTPQKYRQFERYARLPNIRVDLGSERSIDMSYVSAADLYLGDVSSQVAEYLCRPRPCLFLNAHTVQWRDDPNYLFWKLGPLLESVDDLGAALSHAVSTHTEYREVQRAYVADSFGLCDDSSSAVRGSDAIMAFLESEAVSHAPVVPRNRKEAVSSPVQSSSG